MACVVDGATGAIVACVAARDAVFVTTANATETGTLCLAAIAADGASVEARPASAAAATSSASSFQNRLRALLARVHLSERADAPDGDRDRGRDRDGDRSVSAYRIFDGPELGSVAVACFVDERTSVFATFRLDAQNAARSRSRVAALLLDEPGERVVAAAWQLVGRGDGSRADAAPWGGLAVLTNRRLLLYEYALSDDDLVNVALTKRAETRNEIGQTIGSVLWVGPALLFSRADGVFVLGWDGGVSTACACGVGGGAELALSAATEDALLLFLDAADAGGRERERDERDERDSERERRVGKYTISRFPKRGTFLPARLRRRRARDRLGLAGRRETHERRTRLRRPHPGRAACRRVGVRAPRRVACLVPRL